MKTHRIFTALLILSLAAISCNLPASNSAGTEETTGTFTPVVETLTPALTITPGPSPTACNPSITANSNANVRSGPGTAYGSVDNLTAGTTVTVTGKNNDSSWWYINRPAGGTGWVSASVATANCIPDSLAIIAAPPISSSSATSAPTSGVSGTCKDNYVWRLINANDKVCVPASSKAQADADNADAPNRLYISAYGPDTCMEGYSWRNAFPDDHVCVTSNVIVQTAQDNAAAASRVDPGGIYGPDSCKDGFGWVWRDAGPNDHVCVTGDVRTQAAQDNAAAEARKAINFYGADACFTAYVWREAFPGDHVCVTPAVRSQTAADNAAAPSHTWP
jgi:uncharacterized protein YraI